MRHCPSCEDGKQQGIWDGHDPLTEALRRDVREKVERILSEEIDAALGAGAHERVLTRVGYRNGLKEREINTPLGKKIIAVPRGQYFEERQGVKEWHSHILPRYAKRAKAVDAALIAMYLGGVNTRRIKTVMRPLLRGTPLSKSAGGVPTCGEIGVCSTVGILHFSPLSGRDQLAFRSFLSFSQWRW